MQRALLLKTMIVAVLMIAIGIPLALIQSTIQERMRFRDEAVRSIAADSVREQTLLGPLLVIPYQDQYEEREEVIEEQSKRVKTTRRTLERRALVFPQQLRVDGAIDTDQRYRGLHKVLVYTGQYAISGSFVLPKPEHLAREKPDSRITVGRPYVALGIEDVRGIRDIPKLEWGGKSVEFQHGSGLRAFRSGMHAVLDSADAGSVKFALALGLDGIERQHFVPLAKDNQVALKSKWPHPQFGGRFLPSPQGRRIDASGFAAAWNISGLATNAQQQLSLVEQAPNAGEQLGALDRLDRFSVGFIEPVNVYSQADRAVKYGLLFIALTFAAFFLFEIMKRLPIHPVQYALVGLALTLFFLLLVSLSEHIDFTQAYAIASGACVLLIGFYLRYVLHDGRRAFGFASALTLLYGVLYGLLRSESNALLMGSILLFAVLAAIMIATRKVDWYQVGKGEAAPQAA
jgi:inner membrane protein